MEGGKHVSHASCTHLAKRRRVAIRPTLTSPRFPHTRSAAQSATPAAVFRQLCKCLDLGAWAGKERQGPRTGTTSLRDESRRWCFGTRSDGANSATESTNGKIRNYARIAPSGLTTRTYHGDHLGGVILGSEADTRLCPCPAANSQHMAEPVLTRRRSPAGTGLRNLSQLLLKLASNS